jgi:hypothetical protein
MCYRGIAREYCNGISYDDCHTMKWLTIQVVPLVSVLIEKLFQTWLVNSLYIMEHEIVYSVTVLLCYTVSILTSYCVTMLFYSVNVLLCFCFTVLLCYFVNVLRCYCFSLLMCFRVILLLCYHFTVLPCYCVKVLLCNLVTVLPRAYKIFVPWVSLTFSATFIQCHNIYIYK